MKRVFKEVATLDQKCYNTYKLSEDLLMEHAALGLKEAIPKGAKSILIVSGPGNNGADGIALARILHKDKDISLFIPHGTKSKMAQLQLERAQSIAVNVIDKIDTDYDVIIDALFGSGLSKPLDETTQTLLVTLNALDGYKIACDIPTGIDLEGKIHTQAFIADVTVTMGALKEALYSDKAKDYTGKIKCIDLGISHTFYEEETKTYLLTKKDMKLPHRTQHNSHKGDFGHLSVVAGKKQGAGVLAAEAAYAFGAGLVTVIENEPYTVPYELMSSTTLPHSNTAVCIGMGLGNQFDNDCLSKFLLRHDQPIIADADLFYREILVTVLEKQSKVVLTPHPKEFISLLKMTKLADVSVEEVQNNRFKYVKLFSQRYPKVVLLLKGANTLIAKDSQIYIQRFGTNVLSKGGSGDVLSGLIGALLAQGYEPLDAAITGSLAHAFSAQEFKQNSYALTPQSLIEGVKCL
ncbi:MAG: NAD(P)H-hydrate dehydratase [Epsilonproteobacteria bacterium]|nr:NAD(P)H-hydrate dehydratase [Campylobacterota bacterium]